MQVFAYEVDNYTDRYKPLADSQDELDAQMNLHFKAVEEKLKKGVVGNFVQKITDDKSCDKETLYKKLKSEIGGINTGVIEDYAVDSPKIKKHVPKSQNIYSDADPRVVGTILKYSGLHPSINLAGNYVGTDKLSHFFDQGYEYFKIFSKEKDYEYGIMKALDYGKDQEKGIRGTSSTGIYSHGDLAANFSGFKFWLAMTTPPNPYFKCIKGNWQQVRDFHWREYANSGWDEAINCSEYGSTELAKAVKASARKLEQQAAAKGIERKYVCPVSENECRTLGKNLHRWSHAVLHFDCEFVSTTKTNESRYSAQDAYTEHPAAGSAPNATSSFAPGTK